MKTLAFAFIGVCVAAVAVRGMQDQAPQATPAFEVVSVKPSNPNPNSPLMIPMVLPAGNGRLSATNVPLRLLVRMAYPEQGGVTVDSYGDYRAVSGVQVAHKRETRNVADGKNTQESAVLEVTKAEINPKFDAAVFARPAAGAK